MSTFSKKLLLAKTEKYAPNEVILDATPSAYAGTFELLQKGVFKIEIVGAGGGGALAISWASSSSSNYRGNRAAASGGSGACFVGEVFCEKGSYSYYCGTGGTRRHTVVYDGSATGGSGTGGGSAYIESSDGIFYMSATGGGGGTVRTGYTSNINSATGGSGGTINIGNNVVIKSYSIRSNGSTGATKTGRSTSTSTSPSASTSNCNSPYKNIDSTVGFGGGSSSNGGSAKLKITYLRKK